MSLKSLIDQPKDLLALIDSCLKPKQEEKKKFGEVFTPMSLVNEMLDKVDEHYIKEHQRSIFSEKTFKWFDPANGMGNFPIAVYLRLMDGLTTIEDPQDRKRHILENMLYMSELNKKNVFVCRQIFDISNEYRLNLYCGDSLTMDPKKVWGVKTFDVIVGNPPYQDKTDGKRKGGYGGRALWEKFVEMAFSIVDNNKYIVMVHPSNWRKPEHVLWDIFISKQIVHLDIHGENDGIKTFKASTRYDWYVIQNKNYKNKTSIRDEIGKIHKLDLRNWKFLPNYMFEEIKNIITVYDGIDVIYSRTNYGTDKKNVKMKKEGEYKYPIIHNMTQKGLGYVYSNTKEKGHFNIPKVILSFGRHQYPYNDYKGEYGMSQIVYGIPIKNRNEGDNIVKAINSNIFKDIIKATKWNTFYTEWRMFKYFKTDFWKEFIELNDEEK